MTERCPRCRRPMGQRRVGLGVNPVVWMCLSCFELAMAEIGGKLRKLKQSIAKVQRKKEDES